MAALKVNNSGIIPIFNIFLTVSFQRFDTGRKSRSNSNKIKAIVATNEPSGIPTTVVIENVPDEIGLKDIKAASIFITPDVDSIFYYHDLKLINYRTEIIEGNKLYK
jgi:hypothetical protein